MTEETQTQRLANEVDNLIDRFRAEYDMTYASVVGVLQMKIHLLCNESQDGGDEAAPPPCDFSTRHD